ncbi:MAG TPA: carboxypeptidase regulatory-like domain-containing protein [Bryobacteraceae bacterium]|nr:carboxypeptidase regulatory-like domain-containing protein [Bryobacteraceae bacterium]
MTISSLRVCAAFLFALGVGLAQEFRSTLSGRVIDSSGAAVPGIKVTAINNETGARFETTSTDAGEYTIPFLAPGPYRLQAEAQGFKQYVQERIQIGTNTRVSQEITLEIGSQTEAVTVTADASLLQTATASVGQVIGTQQIENLPMNGRTPLTLAQLSFGVTPSSDPRFTRPFDNGGPAGFSMGGGQSQSNELLLDGTPDMTRNRRVAYNPPVDAVSEIKVEAFQPDAAYGNTGGGTVNVVMKGGTNDFHGSVYEFNQVSRLKAVPIFTKRAGQAKPVTRFNQYGLSAGGPLVIPKVIDGHNKLFWFFSYEGIKQSEPEPTFSTVPTQEQRNGDFSALLNINNNYRIYDPATGVLQNEQVTRQQFPGNIIPANRLSPIAKSIISNVPLPNQPGVVGVNGFNGTNNYFNNAVRSDNFSGYLGRLDVNLSEKHKFFWSFRQNDRIEDRSDRFGNDVNGNYLSRVNWGTTIDDVYTLSPTLLLNTRAGWTRFVEGSTRQSTGFDPTSVGLPDYIKTNSTRLLFPRIDFGQITDLSDSGGDSKPFDTFQIFSTLTKVASSHTLKFGVDLRQQRESSTSFGNSVGQYTFATNWTNAGSGAASAPLGQDIAAFMLGLPTGGNYDLNTSRTQSANYYSAFIQDDWRVASNLTLNIGLRYERETGTIERFNRTTVGFDPTGVNSVANAARAAYAAAPIPELPASQFQATGGVLFANDDMRTVYDTYPWAFSPRLGISWSPLSRTVIRGGAGVFYNTYGTTGIQQPGFSQQTALPANQDNYLTPTVTLADPFPSGIQQPVGAARGFDTFLGQNVTYTNRDLAQPYVWRWSFNIQQELGRNMLVEIGYIGSRASKLLEVRSGSDNDLDRNYIPLEQLSTSPVRDQSNITRLSRSTPNPFAGLLPGTNLNGRDTTVEQLLRPYPQFNGSNGVRMIGANTGRSWFHMFQTRFEKRYSSGFNFLTNFQWQKMMEEMNRLNPADPFLEHRIADEDRPLRLVLSGTYELPFGQGKPLLSDTNGFVKRIVGGWQFNAIYIMQSGSPIDWTDRSTLIYFGGDINLKSREIDGLAFDTARFETRANQQLGQNRRVFPTRFGRLRSDGVNNLDASVIKNTQISERLNLQFRAEMFNALNRFQFNGPETNPTSGTFGRITSAANLPRAVQLALRLRW